jgi:hypothetical protein
MPSLPDCKGSVDHKTYLQFVVYVFCKNIEKYWKYVVRTAYPTSTYSNWEVLIVQLPYS